MAKQSAIRTGRREIDELLPLIRSFLLRDVLELWIDGKSITGFRSPDAKSIWIRDHSDMLRAGRYFHEDVFSAVAHFAETQSRRGRIFDYFTTFPEKPPSERENWTKYVRVPVEADVEYRFVKAVYLAWQAGADDIWLAELLPSMESALQYVLTHPWYWDQAHGLVKRAYTIDTWDFAYSAGAHDWLQFQITDDTFWGIMHGDNSGYYEAFQIMARLHQHLGDPDRAAVWEDRAQTLKRKLNALCWNGTFYTHFVKLTPVTVPGVDEARQLSLSNPMAINRGVADHDQACAIIREYQRRRETTPAFAEWFSIDPPFPDGVFGDPRLKAGAYVNGGIMPLVGGELAKAAFNHGFESYGVDILRRYHALIGERNETYLWYFPDGRAASVATSTSPEAEPTDGWGSSSMLVALVEGLAGIEDRAQGFVQLRLSPRWAAAGVQTADVDLAYAASGRSVGYSYSCRDGRVTLELRAGGEEIVFHILLPEGSRAGAVTTNGQAVAFRNVRIEQSGYVDFECRGAENQRIEVELA